jgi:uncharacterized beta-barrel protein YwiB (DUF1934 family)
MEEKYLIHITNQQRVDRQKDEITLTTKGTYVMRDGKRYIMYREFDQHDEKGQSSTLKIDYNSGAPVVSLIRHDPRSGRSNLVLEEGKRHLCQYGTPYGSLTLGVFTSKIDDCLNDHGGKLELEYTLDVNSNLSSINAITITIKEIDPSDGMDAR